MPKRIGFLYEKVISASNCAKATVEMTKGKSHNKRAMLMRENAEMYGEKIAEELANNTWKPKPYKEHTVQDGHRGKKRDIKVPCLHDQAVHHAIMRITAPYIERRNYFYNCGSIPGAGQMRATRAMKRWMNKKNICKYCEQLDIHHFYESCPHWAIMTALKRIFKDERFLDLHHTILDSMGDGLAIGFYPSQWYANLVLMWVDNCIKQELLPDCHYVRYMDDMCILGNDKRKLHKARDKISEELQKIGMILKHSFQVFKIGVSGVSFLSYRFFCGYTLVRKKLMLRINRKVKKSGRIPTLHNALSVISYLGILKYCDSYHFFQKWVYPRISIKKYRRIISYENRNLRNAAVAV